MDAHRPWQQPLPQLCQARCQPRVKLCEASLPPGCQIIKLSVWLSTGEEGYMGRPRWAVRNRGVVISSNTPLHYVQPHYHLVVRTLNFPSDHQLSFSFLSNSSFIYSTSWTTLPSSSASVPAKGCKTEASHVQQVFSDSVLELAKKHPPPSASPG